MATLLPTSQSTGVEAYEDMFKEITRKLYGEESAHGLYPHNTQVAQLAPGTPSAPEGGERSFTTLVSDRSLAQLEYDNAVNEANNGFKSEDHLTTAFGLAALMQNGFPPPGAILNPVNFPAVTATTKQNTNERWQQAAEEILPWNTNKLLASSVSPYSGTSPQKLFKIKTKVEPQETSPANNNNNNNTTTLNIPTTTSITSPDRKSNYSMVSNPGVSKRYTCQSCPYSTDRRDLFTRHENIHKEEKPFHCYACLKQFNRADHVKKHFLRMHREMEYDISKTRRHTTSNNKNYYASNNQQQAQQAQQSQSQQQQNPPASQQQQQQQQQSQQHQASTLNIPTATFPSQLTAQSHHSGNNMDHQQSVNQDVSIMNGIQTHQQQQLLAQTLNIKQEKISVPPTISGNSSVDEKPFKKKGEKRFMCCYCPWSGADNWGLKRHLNTHTKPFVCLLCDYKAARSERLATHVFKVHNKKACNKCNFFADDQQQLASHQMEVHPHDVKPARSTNPTSNTNSHVATSSSNNTNNNNTTNNSNNNNANTGNVLRNLGNTFVPNTPLSNLHNNIQSTTNVFGSNTTSNASGLYHTTSNNTNLIETMNQHLTNNSTTNWMSKTSTTTSSAPSRKRGAELLFSYMEADGSDSEDYARLLHMQAISRNTASVAQDFHNAGGGTKNQSDNKKENNKINNNNKKSVNNNKDYYNNLNEEQRLELLTLIAAAQQQQQQEEQQEQKKHQSQAMSMNYSPPATSTINNNNSNNNNNNNNMNTNNSTNLNVKRRRRSSHDKENNDESKKLAKLGMEHKINNSHTSHKQNINDIFDKLYKKSYNMFLSSTFTKPIEIIDETDDTKISKFSLLEFLKNNDEVSISSVGGRTKTDNNVSNLDEKRSQRKQTQPRKIEKEEKFCVSDFRDKHLNRLLVRQKCCRLCQRKNKQETFYYHSKQSLILHKLWRHNHSSFNCRCCDEKFPLKYKMRLHLLLVHKIRRSKKVMLKKRI